jgi:hypothetical protein
MDCPGQVADLRFTNSDFFMQRPPWGELSTFEWSEDLRRLQSGQQVATYAMKPSYRKLTAETFLEQLESRRMAKLLDRLTFSPRPLLRHLLDIDDHRFTLHAFPD